MIRENSRSSTVQSFVMVLFVYTLSIILAIIFPFGILLLTLGTYLISPFLSLRIATVCFVAITNNQYTLIGIANEFNIHNIQLSYINGILFYYIIFILFTEIIKPHFSKSLLTLMFLFAISFFKSYPSLLKATLIFFNVVGGFLALFILLNSSLRTEGIRYLNILLRDFFNIIVIITFLSMLALIINLLSDSWLLKFHAKYLEFLRGGSDFSSSGIAETYITSIGPIENWIRYTPLLNDPVRAAYWYLYMSIFVYFFLKSNFKYLVPKLLILLINFLFLVLCLSKGSLLLGLYTILFSFLFKKRMYKTSFFAFVSIVILLIILSTTIKSSAAIHVMGLILPFKQNISLEFFIGNKLALAGNMGRIPGENWINSVTRGAESLVGTYMYAVGLLGILFYFKIHLDTIKLKISEGKYTLAALITGSLINTFLQEGHYNIMQVFPLLMISLLFGKSPFRTVYNTRRKPL